MQIKVLKNINIFNKNVRGVRKFQVQLTLLRDFPFTVTRTADGSIAQSVERLPPIPKVPGSSPNNFIHLTFFFKKFV